VLLFVPGPVLQPALTGAVGQADPPPSDTVCADAEQLDSELSLICRPNDY